VSGVWRTQRRAGSEPAEQNCQSQTRQNAVLESDIANAKTVVNKLLTHYTSQPKTGRPVAAVFPFARLHQPARHRQGCATRRLELSSMRRRDGRHRSIHRCCALTFAALPGGPMTAAENMSSLHRAAARRRPLCLAILRYRQRRHSRLLDPAPRDPRQSNSAPLQPAHSVRTPYSLTGARPVPD